MTEKTCWQAVLIIALSSTKSCVSFLKFWFLAKIFNVHYCLWNQPHFRRNSDKSILSLKQNNLKEIWDTVLYTKDSWRRLCQYKPSPNIPCTILLFKVRAFLQIFFPRKSKFWERQFFSVVNVWHSFPY